jgi:nucleosome binding factor SPN SPT16 subunit
MYQVYQLEDNASVTLSLLSVGLKRKDMCFILKNMGRVKRHIIVRFVLRDRLLMSLKLTIMGSWKKSLNCNIIATRIEYFYSNAIGIAPLTEES